MRRCFDLLPCLDARSCAPQIRDGPRSDRRVLLEKKFCLPCPVPWLLRIASGKEQTGLIPPRDRVEDLLTMPLYGKVCCLPFFVSRRVTIFATVFTYSRRKSTI